MRSCTASQPSPGRLGADRAAPLHRSGGSSGRGMKRKGMLPGGRGGDWEVKEGVGVKTWGWGAGLREARATEVTARGQSGARAGGGGAAVPLG